MWIRVAPIRLASGIPAQWEVWRARQVVWPCQIRSLSVKHATGDRRVGVDTPVAQERPIPANVFEMMQVHFAEKNLFLRLRRFGQHAATKMAKKRSSPKL